MQYFFDCIQAIEASIFPDSLSLSGPPNINSHTFLYAIDIIAHSEKRLYAAAKWLSVTGEVALKTRADGSVTAAYTETAEL